MPRLLTCHRPCLLFPFCPALPLLLPSYAGRHAYCHLIHWQAYVQDVPPLSRTQRREWELLRIKVKANEEEKNKSWTLFFCNQHVYCFVNLLFKFYFFYSLSSPNSLGGDSLLLCQVISCPSGTSGLSLVAWCQCQLPSHCFVYLLCKFYFFYSLSSPNSLG